MKLPTTEKEIKTYTRGVESATEYLNISFERAYLNTAEDHFVTDGTLDYACLNTPEGRMGVVDDLISRMRTAAKEYVGFTPKTPDNEQLMFRDVYGVSALDLKIHFAQHYKDVARGNIRDVFQKRKVKALAEKQHKLIAGAGLTIDEKTGNLVKEKDEGRVLRHGLMQEEYE